MNGSCVYVLTRISCRSPRSHSFGWSIYGKQQRIERMEIGVSLNTCLQAAFFRLFFCKYWFSRLTLISQWCQWWWRWLEGGRRERLDDPAARLKGIKTGRERKSSWSKAIKTFFSEGEETLLSSSSFAFAHWRELKEKKIQSRDFASFLVVVPPRSHSRKIQIGWKKRSVRERGRMVWARN